MKVEVLYIPGCPHVPLALARVRQALSREAMEAEISEILVEDLAAAEALRFSISPTIRVAGWDVPEGLQPAAAPPALTCRFDPRTGGSGIPSIRVIRNALRQARRRSS